MKDIKQRISSAAESILENEQLTTGLDDQAAQVLIDWGIACARQIAQWTLGMDDEQAENAMYQPMRATRRLMRRVTRWVTRYDILGEEEQFAVLQEIVSQAARIFGDSYQPPTEKQLQAFLQAAPERGADPAAMIAGLRQLVENKAASTSEEGV